MTMKGPLLVIMPIQNVITQLEVNKKKYKVRLQMDDGGVEIKIHDVSENVTKDEMLAALKQYGDALNMCYPAIIQSGGNYSLKFIAFSDKNYLYLGSIICALDARNKSYCSNVVRTLPVNPTETIQKHYTLLLNLEEELLKVITPVKKLSEVFDVGMDYAQKKDKSKVLPIELDFRENSL
ncbi:FACT complex subunit spt16-like [Ochlerotatus camptorhynchus]|uniref:FACT complex subunit spt16-like n=1 Tax=Ochlerotatus camptorhynchus TaxID=644619 RepID=UPI0031D48E52